MANIYNRWSNIVESNYTYFVQNVVHMFVPVCLSCIYYLHILRSPERNFNVVFILSCSSPQKYLPAKAYTGSLKMAKLEVGSKCYFFHILRIGKP